MHTAIDNLLILVSDTMKESFNRKDVVQRVRDLTSGKYGIDQSLRPNDDGPAESFRKLNVS